MTDDASKKIKELEDQVATLNTQVLDGLNENDELQNKIKDLEDQIEEMNKKGGSNAESDKKIKELEAQVVSKDQEIQNMMIQQEENEDKIR